MSHFT